MAERVAAGGVSIRQSLVLTTTMSESTAISLSLSLSLSVHPPPPPPFPPPGAKRFPMVPIEEEEEHPLDILYPPPFYLFCYDPTQMFAKVERTHIHHLTLPPPPPLSWPSTTLSDFSMYVIRLNGLGWNCGTPPCCS